MQLSPHFKLVEFTRSATAQARHIDNTPNEEQIKNLKFLCDNVLEPLREQFGPIIIGSGFRCPALNTAVGGVKDSQHKSGEACDIHLPSIEVGKKYFEFLKKLPIFDQLIWERNNPRSNHYWIHVSVKRSGKNRKQVIPLLNKHS